MKFYQVAAAASHKRTRGCYACCPADDNRSAAVHAVQDPVITGFPFFLEGVIINPFHAPDGDDDNNQSNHQGSYFFLIS
jgi:hypothetical protein